LVLLLPVTNKEFAMRKLTPEERAAKKAAKAHVHTADCGHAVEAVTVAETPVAVAEEAPVAEPVAEEAPTEEAVEDKPKRGRKKAEEAVEEA
jgi:hypothetical protein